MRVRLTRTDLLLLCAVVVWAGRYSLVKYGPREIAALAFAAAHFRICVGLLVVQAWVTEGTPVIKREDWLRIVLLGLAQTGVCQTFFSVGLLYATAADCSLLDGTAPIWTALIAIAARQERIDPSQAVGMLISFAGLILVITAGNVSLALTWENFRGDALILIASILTAMAALVSE